MIIDAILTPAEIDLLPQQNLTQSVCIVFDVLRATSSILTGLAHGTEEIRPVVTIEEALKARDQWPDAVLGGERFGDRIEGTVALRACSTAQEVWAGALLNMQALEDRLRQVAPEAVTLVCAGTFRELALEDVLAAGMLAAAFPDAMLTDAAQVARSVYIQHREDIRAALEQSKNGRVLLANGRGDDVAWCAQRSCFPLVGILRDGVIRRG